MCVSVCGGRGGIAVRTRSHTKDGSYSFQGCDHRCRVVVYALKMRVSGVFIDTRLFVVTLNRSQHQDYIRTDKDMWSLFNSAFAFQVNSEGRRLISEFMKGQSGMLSRSEPMYVDYLYVAVCAYVALAVVYRNASPRRSRQRRRRRLRSAWPCQEVLIDAWVRFAVLVAVLLMTTLNLHLATYRASCR